MADSDTSPMATTMKTPLASSSSGSRTQRCGVCQGCTAKACGVCVFCQDSPHFGGPGLKKQSCLDRRCVRVLEFKLQREAQSVRIRKGCGVCEDCREEDCGVCLICMDKRFFQGQFLHDAMCTKKKCANSRPVDRGSDTPKPGSLKKTRLSARPNGEHISSNGSSRHSICGSTPIRHSRYNQTHSESDGKRRKTEWASSDSSSESSSPLASPSTGEKRSRRVDVVSMMERAFSRVIQQTRVEEKVSQPHSDTVGPRPSVQPATSSEPSSAPADGSTSGGTSGPICRNLPIATASPEATFATWNPQSAKVLYPISVETFLSSQGNGKEGFIVTLDGDQLKQHLAGNPYSTAGPCRSPATAPSGDPEDIELHQKLIQFYQRDKQQQSGGPGLTCMIGGQTKRIITTLSPTMVTKSAVSQ